MKHLLPVLLICLSPQASGKEPSGYTTPINVMGTNLQQDFEFIYHEVLRAEEQDRTEFAVRKKLSGAAQSRAVGFLEHSLSRSQHTCREVDVHPFANFGFFGMTEADRVVIWFECADGSYDFLLQNLALYIRNIEGIPQYFIEFYWAIKPGRNPFKKE